MLCYGIILCYIEKIQVFPFFCISLVKYCGVEGPWRRPTWLPSLHLPPLHHLLPLPALGGRGGGGPPLLRLLPLPLILRHPPLLHPRLGGEGGEELAAQLRDQRHLEG